MRKLLFFIVLLLLLSGCNISDSNDTSVDSISNTSNSVLSDPGIDNIDPIPTFPDTMPTSVPAIENTTLPTTENLFDDLDISAGSYLLNYNPNSFSEQMSYWLFVPENAHTDMPLVVFLHGLGEVGKIPELNNFGMIEKAREFYGDEFPFLAINPCLPVTSWIKGNYPALLKDLIDSVCLEYQVNPDKIILTGHSLGSIGTWYMISQYGDYFSAAVPISCGCDAILNYDNMVKVPVLPFVGDADEYEVRYRGGMERIIAELNNRGCNIELNILFGQHHGQTKTDAYTPDVFEWMLSQ